MSAKRKFRLSVEGTDSAELVCRNVDYSGSPETPRPWFWVPETGMLRRWGQSIVRFRDVRARG